MEGWIKLHRKFLDWEWFETENMVKLFLFLLLKSNHKDGKWRGIDIKRGQMITGLHSLSEKTKISIQSLRTCLMRLENTGEINTQVTNKYRLITVCNYDSYQDDQQATNKQTNNQSTINQQSTNNQSTTNKNVKKEENDNNVKNRIEIFKKEVLEFKDEYPKGMLSRFIIYWTEPNKSKTKFRQELEKTWDMKGRLSTWKSRSSNFENSQDKNLYPGYKDSSDFSEHENN